VSESVREEREWVGGANRSIIRSTDDDVSHEATLRRARKVLEIHEIVVQ
jgi:hypothetical protein